MPLQYTKVTIAVLWVLAAGIVGMATGVTSAAAWALMVMIGVLPPAVMLLLWKEPPQSMAESIRSGRR